jgi:hypothetical protein
VNVSPCRWEWKGYGKVVGKGWIIRKIGGSKTAVMLMLDACVGGWREGQLVIKPLFAFILIGFNNVRQRGKDWLAVVIVIYLRETISVKLEDFFPLLINGFVAW